MPIVAQNAAHIRQNTKNILENNAPLLIPGKLVSAAKIHIKLATMYIISILLPSNNSLNTEQKRTAFNC